MNVFCPNCENECSEAARACPKCGHPLRARRISLKGLDPGWVVSLLIIGAVLLCVLAANREEGRAQEATKRSQDATNKWLVAKRVRQQHIETLSDRREEGGLTADESRLAVQLAERISQKLPSLDDWAVDEAVAFLFGTGASKEDIEEAAFLVHIDGLEFDPHVSAERRARRVLRSAQRP